MIENYEHYISRNIKLLYKKRLIAPILYLLLTIAVWFYYPVTAVVLPTELGKSDDLSALYKKNDRFVHATLTDLHFTGYTQTTSGITSGYFYYYEEGNQCYLVLLSPSTCEQGLPEISSVAVFGKVNYQNASFNEVLKNLSSDLNWTNSGIHKKVSSFYLSEPHFHYSWGMILFLVLSFTDLYALFTILSHLVYIAYPWLAPCCRNLAHYGKSKQLLAEAEEELATLPQVATEDMFITEHYFIEISNYGIALVPISEILWIYKHSTLHKLFWYHFRITYTLNITASHRLFIHCPKNIKSDIDGIMDYLSEANHSILVGFNEENRKIIHDIQGDPFHIERLIAFLNRKHPAK